MRGGAPGASILLRPSPSGRRGIEPITVGIAVPRGVCRDPRDAALVDAAGRRLPLQAQPLEHWSDGSVRWLLLDFQAILDGDTLVYVQFGASDESAVVSRPAKALREGASIKLSNGVLSLVAEPGAHLPFVDVARDGRSVIDPARTCVTVRLTATQAAPVIVSAVEIERDGPLRAAARIAGHVAGTDLRVSCRLEVFAGLPIVRMRVTLHNPRAAQHPTGFWELGDPGSIFLEQASFAMAPPAGSTTAEVRCSVARDEAMEVFARPFRVHQESSGRANWQSPVHVTRTGVIEPRYSGYKLTAAGSERAGTATTPLVHVASGEHGLSVTSRLFWEVFPKAYAVDEDGLLSIDILPADRREDHELQGGERCSHDFAIAFDADPHALAWVRAPATAIVDPTWWCEAGDVSSLSLAADIDDPYERLVRAAIVGDDTFVAKRDRIDEYGWRHYGDLYADHENGPAADRLRVSHYNNQYDGIAGLLTQFMRSGDARWWDLGRDLAHHVRDTDIYWTDRDKSAYNGGLFWHTYHYVDAGRASHRSYPNAAGVPGGGPSSEHNYSTGLLLHHLMTGDPDSRDAVLRLARWTRDMDEGTGTVFRYLSRGATGLVSATGAVDYHGPGRAPGNAIHTLLNAARLTGDPSWLSTAEALIRRCVHPTDDLDALNLLDAERRWYYTVFLQALGRYLGFKSERGEEDAAWCYARASLLHYARWMAAHEYPYLDKPELLEYPNETWAAQDMRKCEVFDLAAQYAESAAERARFVERARFFFAQSVTTLNAWTSRTWTRPVVLMLSYGYAHRWHEAHRDELPRLRPIEGDFGQPSGFEPQKTIALRRAKWLAAGLAAIGLVGLVLAAASL